jgi:hypothetical protein
VASISTQEFHAMPLAAVIVDLREFLLPVLMSVASNNEYDAQWQSGKGWQHKS